MIALPGRSTTALNLGSAKRKILVFAFLFMSILTYSQDEPALKIEVNIDGNKVYLNDGDTIKIEGKPVVIQTGKVKTFKLAQIRFDYPRDYAYKFEEDFAYRSWTFDGNNFVVMLFEMPTEMDITVFVKEMVKRFGKKNCKVSDRKITLNKYDLSGKRINVSMLGASLSFDLYPLSLQKDRMHIIAFQDTKTDSGADSEEGEQTMALIAKSIELTK